MKSIYPRTMAGTASVNAIAVRPPTQPKINPAEVCRVGWWMGHYNARSAKRQYAYSNSAAVRKLNKGALKATARKAIKKKVATTIRSIGPDGTERYTASKHLKPSEILGYITT